VAFFLDEVVQLFLELEELDLLRVLRRGELGLFHRTAEFRVLHAAGEGAVLWLAHVDLEQFQAGLLVLACGGGFLGFGDQTIAQRVLAAHELLHERLVALVLMIALGGHDGTADDQGVRASSMSTESTSSTMAK
jgi:hypothetical protein